MKHRTPVTAHHEPLQLTFEPIKRRRHKEPAIDPAQERLMRRAEVLRVTGLSRTSMYRLIAKLDFPRPVSLSAKTVGWPASQVNAWIAARVAASRPQQGS